MNQQGASQQRSDQKSSMGKARIISWLTGLGVLFTVLLLAWHLQMVQKRHDKQLIMISAAMHKLDSAITRQAQTNVMLFNQTQHPQAVQASSLAIRHYGQMAFYSYTQMRDVIAARRWLHLASTHIENNASPEDRSMGTKQLAKIQVLLQDHLQHPQDRIQEHISAMAKLMDKLSYDLPTMVHQQPTVTLPTTDAKHWQDRLKAWLQTTKMLLMDKIHHMLVIQRIDDQQWIDRWALPSLIAQLRDRFSALRQAVASHDHPAMISHASQMQSLLKRHGYLLGSLQTQLDAHLHFLRTVPEDKVPKLLEKLMYQWAKTIRPEIAKP